MSALREVLAIFDIVVNDSQLDTANKKLDSFVDKLKGVGQAFAGFMIVKSIAAFGEHVAAAAREAEFGAARIGMQADEYQRLAQVADNYGVKVEQLQISTRMLIRGLSDAGGTMGTFSSRTHFAKDALHNLGIDAAQFKGKGLQDILPVIADGFKNVEDPVERTAIALRLFGHRGLSILPMMAAGGEELRRQFAAAVPVFEDLTIKSANEATIAGKLLSRTWDNLVNNSFGRAVLDTFTVVAKKLTDIVLFIKDLTKYSEIGKGVLVALGTALAVAAAVALAAWWPVLAPILAVLAAIAALSLAVDDFIVFMKDGDSVLGDFFDSILGPGGAEKVRDALAKVWDFFKDFTAWILGNKVDWNKYFDPATLEAIGRVVEKIRAALAWIKGALRTAGEFVGDQFTANPDSTPVKQRDYDRFVDAANRGLSYVPNGAPSVPAARPAVPYAPGGQDYGTGAMLSPNYNFQIINPIDGHELAGHVRKVVENHQDRALRDAMAGAGGSK